MWLISVLVIAHAMLGRTNALSESWGVAGCWFDDPGARTLSAASFVDETFNTGAACASFCDERHFKYAGVEFGRECFCDNIIRNGATQQPIQDCNATCPGDSLQTCGGPGRLNLFINGASPVLPLELIGNGYPRAWDYIGSFDAFTAWDVLVNPTLKGLRPTDLGNVRDCVDWGYNEATFPLCGTFSDGLCYCADSLATSAVRSEAGNVVCPNDPSVICGGELASGDSIMQVYSYPLGPIISRGK